MRLESTGKVPLSHVTVLVGANGSGKSSLLKAVHWSARCASLSKNGNIALEGMDFAPSLDFRQLAHKSTLKARDRSSSPLKEIVVGFHNDTDLTNITMKSLGNDAGIKLEINGPLSNDFLGEAPQTAYIPGLAGLAEQETILALPMLKRKAASGDSGSVLRQMMLLLHEDTMNTGDKDIQLTKLEKWVGKVIPDIKFWVRFDQRREAYIQAWFLTPDMEKAGGNNTQKRRPLEMAGTGLLQIIQIFTYLLYFKPKLLLIDEPDAHLHPSVQEKLMMALEEASLEFPETQIVITTHSPRLVKAAQSSTQIVWMENGCLKQEGQDVRDQLGWGSLDKELILFSEDKNTDYLQALINQWPELATRTVIWPCFGVGNLPKGQDLADIRKRYKMKVVVHRDTDFMSDNDCNKWISLKHYDTNKIPVWFSPGSDIESCFHSEKHISQACDMSDEDVESTIANCIGSFDEQTNQEDFCAAYNASTSKLEGKSNAINRWNELHGKSISTIKGKDFKIKLEEKLKSHFKASGESIKISKINSIYSGNKEEPLQPQLKNVLEAALSEPIS